MAALQNTNDQPENLRVIQSTVNPDYRAKNDLGELQISFDLTDALTLTSETAYSADQVWSLEDYAPLPGENNRHFPLLFYVRKGSALEHRLTNAVAASTRPS